MLGSYLAYSINLKMEAACSSQTLADFQPTTRRYISEDRIFCNHSCPNLKSYKQNAPSDNHNKHPTVSNEEVQSVLYLYNQYLHAILF
jgi:hypothetical protein